MAYSVMFSGKIPEICGMCPVHYQVEANAEDISKGLGNKYVIVCQVINERFSLSAARPEHCPLVEVEE